jgi:putative oxidoreductase
MSATLTSDSPAHMQPVTEGVRTPLLLLGRVLLALMFVLSGVGKLTDVGGTAAFIASAGLPLASAIAVLVGVFELVAGLALAVGWRARLAALSLGVFTLLASAIFHAYWSAPAEAQLIQQLMFMKNLSVAGGMFFVAAAGAGRLSLDSSRGR